jgi:hypothetical protein
MMRFLLGKKNIQKLIVLFLFALCDVIENFSDEIMLC